MICNYTALQPSRARRNGQLKSNVHSLAKSIWPNYYPHQTRDWNSLILCEQHINPCSLAISQAVIGECFLVAGVVEWEFKSVERGIKMVYDCNWFGNAAVNELIIFDQTQLMQSYWDQSSFLDFLSTDSHPYQSLVLLRAFRVNPLKCHWFFIGTSDYVHQRRCYYCSIKIPSSSPYTPSECQGRRQIRKMDPYRLVRPFLRYLCPYGHPFRVPSSTLGFYRRNILTFYDCNYIA